MAEEAPERTPPGARWMVVETDEQCGLAGVQARALAGGELGGLGEADLCFYARLECEGGCREMQQQNSTVKGVLRRVKRRRRIVIAASTC